MGSRQNVFPQVSWGPLTSLRFLLWTSLRAITVKAEEKGVYGFLVLHVAAQPKVAGPTFAAQQGQPQCEWILLRDHRVGSILPWRPWGCDLSQLLCLRLDVIHPSSTTLPSALPPQVPSQAPWLSHSSGFSASFPPETGLRRWDRSSSSGWSPLGKRRLKVTFSKSSPCPFLSHLVVHQAGPLSWGKPWHWLSPGREGTHKAWNLHVEGFSLGSHLPEAVQGGSPCSYLPFAQLSSWRYVESCLQWAWFTAHKIRLVLDQTP